MRSGSRQPRFPNPASTKYLHFHTEVPRSCLETVLWFKRFFSPSLVWFPLCTLSLSKWTPWDRDGRPTFDKTCVPLRCC